MLVTGHVLASGGPRRALTHVLLCFEPALCDVQGHNAPRHVACQNEDAEEQHVQHDGQRGVDAVHAACFGTAGNWGCPSACGRRWQGSMSTEQKRLPDHGAVRICLDDLTSAGLHIPATTLRLQRTGAIPVRPVPAGESAPCRPIKRIPSQQASVRVSMRPGAHPSSPGLAPVRSGTSPCAPASAPVTSMLRPATRRRAASCAGRHAASLVSVWLSKTGPVPALTVPCEALTCDAPASGTSRATSAAVSAAPPVTTAAPSERPGHELPGPPKGSRGPSVRGRNSFRLNEFRGLTPAAAALDAGESLWGPSTCRASCAPSPCVGAPSG